MIQTLDDITLIPTPARYTRWIGGKSVDTVKEELQAILFDDLKGQR